MIKEKSKDGGSDNCESCVNYVWNEFLECYECLVNLDEDEMLSFLSGRAHSCSYFRLDDEYGVVKKQM